MMLVRPVRLTSSRRAYSLLELVIALSLSLVLLVVALTWTSSLMRASAGALDQRSSARNALWATELLAADLASARPCDPTGFGWSFTSVSDTELVFYADVVDELGVAAGDGFADLVVWEYDGLRLQRTVIAGDGSCEFDMSSTDPVALTGFADLPGEPVFAAFAAPEAGLSADAELACAEGGDCDVASVRLRGVANVPVPGSSGTELDKTFDVSRSGRWVGVDLASIEATTPPAGIPTPQAPAVDPRDGGLAVMAGWTQGATTMTATASIGSTEFGSCSTVYPVAACVVTGLTNGTTYDVTVVMSNSSGAMSSPSPAAQGTPLAAPPPVVGLTATHADSRLTAAWLPPTPEPDSYRVSYRPEGTSSWTTAAVETLDTWFFAGSGGGANRSDVSTPTGPLDLRWSVALDSMPNRNFSGIAAHDTWPNGTNFWLRWSNTGNNYQFSWSRDGLTSTSSVSWSPPVSQRPVTGHVTHRVVHDPADGSARWYSSDDLGETWNLEHTSSFASFSSRFDSETAVRVGAVHSGSWQGRGYFHFVEARDGADGPVAWRFDAADPSGWNLPTAGSFLSKSATIPNLTNGTSYDVRVEAENVAGAGPGEIVAATPSYRMAPPMITEVQPRHEALEVYFELGDDNGSPSTGLRYNVNGGSWVLLPDVTSPALITGLDNGASYAVRLQVSTAADGFSNQSAPMSGVPSSVPAAPQAPNVSSSTMTTQEVSWTPALEPGLFGGRYDGYHADNMSFFDSLTPTDTFEEVTTLSLGNEGTFYSYLWEGYYVPTVSGTHTFRTASDDSSLVWVGDAAVSGYTVGNAVVDNSGTHGVQSRSGTASLTAGQVYPIRIAYGQAGGGAAFDFFVTQPGESETQDLTGLFFSSPGQTLTVDRPSSYHVYRDGSLTGVVDASTGSYTVDELVPGRNYAWQLAACNVWGCSQMSDATVAATAPAAPRDVTVTPSSTTVNVSWLPAAQTNFEASMSDTMGRATPRPFNVTSHSSNSHVTGDPGVPSAPVPGHNVWRVVNSNPDNYSRFGVQQRHIDDELDGFDRTYVASAYVYIPSEVTVGNSTNNSACQSTQGRDWHCSATAPSYFGAGSIRDAFGPADVSVRDAWQRVWVRFTPDSELVSTEFHGFEDNNVLLGMYMRPNLVGQSGDNFLYISGLQIEIGDLPSPLTFDPVLSDVVDGYRVEYRETGSSSWMTATTTASSATSATVSGLTNGTDYEFRVSTLNAAGSTSSRVLSGTPASHPAAPNITSVTPLHEALSVAYSVFDGGSPVTGFEYQLEGDSWTPVSGSISSPLRIDGLTNSVPYTFRIRAVNDMGVGSPSSWRMATPAASPSVPNPPDVSVSGATHTLSWSAPFDGGSPIVSYQLYQNGSLVASFDGSSTSAVRDAGSTSPQSWQLAACNTIGCSPVSLAAVAPGPPATPALVSATGANHAGWVHYQLGSNNGAPVTDVQYRLNTGSGWGSWSSGTTSASVDVFEVGGLENYVAHQVQVRAVNSFGSSNVSVARSFTPTAAAYQDHVVASQPVGFWRLQEAAGPTAANTAGAAPAGSFSGSPTFGAAGPYTNLTDTSVTFSGSEHVTIGNPEELRITGSQTISMWVRPDDASTRQNPFGKAYGGEGSITQEPNRTLHYYYGTAGGNASPYQSFNSNATVTLGEWNHIALVRDLDRMQLHWYVNGVRTNTTTAAYPAAVASSRDARIAVDYVSRYIGSIADVAVHDRALTPDELFAAYGAATTPGVALAAGVNTVTLLFDNSDVAGPDASGYTAYRRLEQGGVRTPVPRPDYEAAVNALNPLLFWRLGDSSSTAADASGNGIHGSYAGGVRSQSGAIPGDPDHAVRNPNVAGPSGVAPLGDAFTLSWWFRGDGTEPSTQYWGAGPRRGPFNAGGLVSVDVRGVGPSASIGVRLDTSSGNNQVRTIPRASVNVWDGEWHHMVLVVDNGSLEWWVDGVRRLSSSYNHGDGFVMTDVPRLAASGGTSDRPDMWLDEYALFDRALSSGEIVDLYDAHAYTLSGLSQGTDYVIGLKVDQPSGSSSVTWSRAATTLPPGVS